jgi:hypothetical protein
MTEEHYRLERDELAQWIYEIEREPSDLSLKLEFFRVKIQFLEIAAYCGLGVEFAKELERTQEKAYQAVIEGRGGEKPWFALLNEFATEIKLKRNIFPPHWSPDRDYPRDFYPPKK